MKPCIPSFCCLWFFCNLGNLALAQLVLACKRCCRRFHGSPHSQQSFTFDTAGLHAFCFVFCRVLPQMNHAINPRSCGKKGGGHKNVRVSKTLRCVSQRRLARKQNTGISTRKLALWPRKWCVSGSASNSLRPGEMKDLFSTRIYFTCLLVSQLGFSQYFAIANFPQVLLLFAMLRCAIAFAGAFIRLPTSHSNRTRKPTIEHTNTVHFNPLLLTTRYRR